MASAESWLDSTLFSVMGLAITIVTIVMARLAVYALRTRFADAALGNGVRVGIVLMVLGSCVAFLMPRPTPAQFDSLRAVGETPAIGAHSVGASDDAGSGLPVTRWSTAGGDLRVPHFIGLHARQLLPLSGLALGRSFRNKPNLAANLTRHVGFAYFGFMLTTLVQALRGQPVVAADAFTWGMLAALLGMTAVSALATSLPKFSTKLARA